MGNKNIGGIKLLRSNEILDNIIEEIEVMEGINFGSRENILELISLCESNSLSELIVKGLKDKEVSEKVLEDIYYRYIDGIYVLNKYMDLLVDIKLLDLIGKIIDNIGGM